MTCPRWRSHHKGNVLGDSLRTRKARSCLKAEPALPRNVATIRLTSMKSELPRTPDGRYFVVKGRLWRLSNPALPDATRNALVTELMAARRDVGLHTRAGNPDGVREARARVDRAKQALGERGPVWWTDGAPDFNRKLVKNTPYAMWFDALSAP